MIDVETRIKIFEDSKKRVASIEFGAPVTNVCAGEAGRHLHFVEYKRNSHKNRFGITHTEHLARCRFSNGKFGNIDIKVIYPGHLPESECKKLFGPIWESEYGSRK